MQTCISHEQETLRLEALRRYDILDTPPEAGFDELTMLAADICEVPVAAMTLMDGNRLWFKSRFHIDAVEVPWNVVLCRHVVETAAPITIDDLRKDQRFKDNPVVVGAPGLRFYAGAPLLTAERLCLGTLCVMDLVPRVLSQRQQRALTSLANQVMRLLDARVHSRTPARHTCVRLNAAQALASNERFLQTLLDALPVGVHAKRLTPDTHTERDGTTGAGQLSHDRYSGQDHHLVRAEHAEHASGAVRAADMLLWNRAAESMLGFDGTAGETGAATTQFPPEIAALQIAQDRALIECRAPVSSPPCPVRRADGNLRMLRMSSVPLFDENGELAYAICITEDVTALNEAELEVRRASRTDSLTRLPNRMQFFEVLVAAVARSRRLDSGLAIVFIDVDQFHSLNEAVGKAEGDQVLRMLANRLKRVVRSTDTVARLAGDEFMVVLEGLRAPAEAEMIAQKILACLTEPIAVGDATFSLQFSAGIAYDRTHAYAPAALIGYADELLYVAKSAGGNTFRMTVC